MPEEQVYRYEGPQEQHALIGQVMAYLGYTGGREAGPVGASVRITVEAGHVALSCVFMKDDDRWPFQAMLLHDDRLREDLKDLLLHWHDRFSGARPSPWGTLIGVRPTKLVHHLFDRGLDDSQAVGELCHTYQVAPATAQELVDMARLQRPYVTGLGRKVALYIGIPYCSSHCLYCSFPSRLVGTEAGSVLDDFAAAVSADLEDLGRLCDDYGLTVDSIYVGGGTPTCLPDAALARIMETAARIFGPVEEWTVEAGRPDTATPSKLDLLRRCGVDRISVNPQTMQQRILDLLGRRHRIEDIYTMFADCRTAGFSVINMDFIAGLPGQTAKDMQENMEIICQLGPENVTIHTLALKKRAPLFHHPLRQEIPEQEEVARMLDLCRDRLQGRGYIPYYMYRQKYMAASFANIGYAQPQAVGKYNIQMMEERQTVLAAGPGGANKFVAHSGPKLEKLYMPKEVDAYIRTLPQRMAERRRLCAIVYGGEDR
jgi:oxygen-independent coproporphyrinogen-3 oxidase